MDQGTSKPGVVQGVFRKLGALTARDGPSVAPPKPDTTRDPLDVLEELQAGKRPDYCLYLGPVKAKGSGPDMEGMLTDAFAPLPWVPLDGYKSPLRRLPTDGRLAEEAFALLAEHARVFLAVPVADPKTTSRLRGLRERGHLWRAVFLMPDAGAFGTADWAAAWEAARPFTTPAGVELPPYTAGGWLFRYEIDRTAAGEAYRAATFRMIAHPTVDRVTRAIEAVCGEMGCP